jgi:hypothetical protein
MLTCFQKAWVIPRDKGKTLRKNKKAHSYPREREKTQGKNKKAWGVGFNPRVCSFLVSGFHKLQRNHTFSEDILNKVY